MSDKSEFEKAFPVSERSETYYHQYEIDINEWHNKKLGALWALKYFVEKHDCNGFMNCNNNHVPCQTIKAMNEEIERLEKL